MDLHKRLKSIDVYTTLVELINKKQSYKSVVSPYLWPILQEYELVLQQSLYRKKYQYNPSLKVLIN